MRVLLFFLFMNVCSSSFAQERIDANLIDVDSDWKKEIFPFPIGFAQDINYEGVEEARFPPEGWSVESHQNYWSYAFAWDINLNHKITAKELERDIEKYFNGLIGKANLEESKVYRSSVIFVQTKTRKNRTYFQGKVKTYDRFTAKQPITLNVLVESYYCNKLGRSVILFRFSLKEFTHPVWNTLRGVELYKKPCRN